MFCPGQSTWASSTYGQAWPLSQARGAQHWDSKRGRWAAIQVVWKCRWTPALLVAKEWPPLLGLPWHISQRGSKTLGPCPHPALVLLALNLSSSLRGLGSHGSSGCSMMGVCGVGCWERSAVKVPKGKGEGAGVRLVLKATRFQLVFSTQFGTGILGIQLQQHGNLHPGHRAGRGDTQGNTENFPFRISSRWRTGRDFPGGI